QKRYGDAAILFEAASNFTEACYHRLDQEINGLHLGEINVFAAVQAMTDANELRVGRGAGGGPQQKPLLLFHLLPDLLARVSSKIARLQATQQEESTNNSLVREIDAALSLDSRKSDILACIPTAVTDVINPQDNVELQPSILTSLAANNYIKAMQYEEAERLIDSITDSGTISDLARVYLKTDVTKALALFKRAGRTKEIVDCLLTLNRVAEAESAVKDIKRKFDAARTPQSPGSSGKNFVESATLNVRELEADLRLSSASLATHYANAGNAKKAIFFSALSGMYDDAFDLAIKSGNEDLLVRVVDKSAPPEFLRKAAKYFATPDLTLESGNGAPRNVGVAAHFLELSGAQDFAIKLLITHGNGTTDIDKAIDLLRTCKSMFEYVIDHLKSAPDGMKRSSSYIFKIFLAMERYSEAAAVVCGLADRETDEEHYSKAKSLLLQCAAKIYAQAGKMPASFRDRLINLHSIDLGKLFAKQEMHLQAAICFYRVSRISSHFGANAFKILLPATVECTRAGSVMAQEGYECARTLLSGHKDQIPEKYLKAVEQVVRKYKRGEQASKGTKPCCSCGEDLPIGLLRCDHCMAVLPLDTATGLQITLADYCECPYCFWTCSQLGLADVYRPEEVKTYNTPCLMCGKKINVEKPFTVTGETFDDVTGGRQFEDQELRPLIVYEDLNLAKRRYEQWMRAWYSE
ncbi:WD-repeat membrane protein, partial [Giardia muris]